MSDEVEELEQTLKKKDATSMVALTLKKRSNAERVKLRTNYKSKKGHDLIDDIEKYMSGDLKSTLMALYRDPVEYDAYLLYKAMKGIGSDKDVISEIICFRNFNRLSKIREKFKEMYKKDLVSELKDETSGDYQKSILYMLQNERNKNSSPNVENCRKIAEEIYNAGENKIGTNESVFTKYFTSLSPQELQLVSKEYHKHYKKIITEVIKSEFSGNEQKLFLDIFYGLFNPSEYYARKIHDSVDGIGTADDQLIRCIVSRCEDDMDLIKRYFKQIFNKNMIERISEDISGDYKKLIEGLIPKDEDDEAN